jgi:hypothetical protein
MLLACLHVPQFKIAHIHMVRTPVVLHLILPRVNASVAIQVYDLFRDNLNFADVCSGGNTGAQSNTIQL